MDSAPDSSSRGTSRQQKRGRHGEDRAASMQEMQISIDSQSFVNLGQLMGSRHGGLPTAASGGSANPHSGLSRIALEDLGTSFLSDDSEGLRDFDQIFHPAAEHGGSTPRPWPGRDLYDQRGAPTDRLHEEGEGRGHVDEDDDDDSDSILPALPSRSSTPGSPRGDSDSGSNKPLFAEAVEAGWAEEDFSTGGAAGADASGGGEERAGRASSGDPRSAAAAAAAAAAATSGGVSLSPATGGGRQTTTVAAAAVVMKPAAGPSVLARGDGAAEDSSRAYPIAAGGMNPTLQAQQRLSDATAAAAAAAAAAGTTGGATGAASSNTTPSLLLRESWLHVPMGDEEDEEGDAVLRAGEEVDSGEGHAQRQQYQRYRDAADAAARARRAAARALGDCGDCLAHGAERAAAIVKLRLEGLARTVKARVEAGTEVCSRGQEAVVKAVDSVPQAPVRVWLGRIAGSLVLGAILGGAVAFYALPKATSTTSASPSSSSSSPSYHAGSAVGSGGGGGGGGSGGGGGDGTSPWWTNVGGEQGAGGAEPNFGDRLNKALFAARAGEAAAQQGLLEEVRNILAATGKSGGISAEQILRQFNAKRFKEASKAWSAADGGNIAGSDPLDPLFFAPPSTPVYPSSSQQQQQQQQQQQPMPQQSPPSIPPGAAPATECAGGASGSAFCSTDGLSGGNEPLRTVYARTESSNSAGGRPQYRRPCPGGWVC